MVFILSKGILSFLHALIVSMMSCFSVIFFSLFELNAETPIVIILEPIWLEDPRFL